MGKAHKGSGIHVITQVSVGLQTHSFGMKQNTEYRKLALYPPNLFCFY